MAKFVLLTKEGRVSLTRMGKHRNQADTALSGEKTMGSTKEVKSEDTTLDDGFNFMAPSDGDFNLSDIDISKLKMSDLDMSLLTVPDMASLMKEPLVSESDLSGKGEDSTINEVTIRKNTRKGTRTLPEPTGDLRKVYVIPSLRYGIVCIEIPCDSHVTKEGAITLKKGNYVPQGRWSWDLDEAKNLLQQKINETISNYQSMIDKYQTLSNPSVRTDTIETYARLCGRDKASVEKYILGVNVLPEEKEETTTET